MHLLRFTIGQVRYYHNGQPLTSDAALEVKRHTPLSDKFCLHFFELKSYRRLQTQNSGKELWLSLFNAKTEEDLAKIEAMEVPIMSTALQAYRHVAASDEFKERERMRAKARHDEAQALRNAQRQRDEHWQSIVGEKDTALAEQAALIAELKAQLSKK